MIAGVLFAWWFLMRIDYNGGPGQQVVAQGPYPDKAFCEKAQKEIFNKYTDMQGRPIWMKLGNIGPGEAEGGTLLESCKQMKGE